MPTPQRQRAAHKPRYTARTADRFELYEKSVQSPSEDIRFLTRVFRKEHGRLPLALREDFCGTAYLCAEWVKSHPQRTALGLDLDAPTLEWGRVHHLEPLGKRRERVSLLRRNVLSVTRPPVDVAVAFNFSYCVFHERKVLLDYCKKVRRSLKDDGMFALDIHGGPESFEELEEETRYPGFTYVWDQNELDAVSNCSLRVIHFRFPDGTMMRNAFVYDWRIWGLPELRDVLLDAGFARVDVYWEGVDRSGEGNGIYRKVTRAENDTSWVAYVVGFR